MTRPPADTVGRKDCRTLVLQSFFCGVAGEVVWNARGSQPLWQIEK